MWFRVSSFDVIEVKVKVKVKIKVKVLAGEEHVTWMSFLKITSTANGGG